MNKLKTTYPAGVDFNWDDLAWMQDATRDAIYGLLSAFGIDPDESFILSGCAVTIGPSSATTTAGYISLNGEILKVEAHSIAYDGSSPVVWRLQETDDPTGTETDSASNTVECYQKRVAILYQASSYTNEMPYNADNLSVVIGEKLDIYTEWTALPFNSAYFSGANLTMGGTTTIYYKVLGKTMIIAFNLAVTSMDASTLTFLLSAATGYKCTKAINSIATLRQSAGNQVVYVNGAGDSTPGNIIFSDYGSSLPALATARIDGQIIIEVSAV